MKFSVSCGKYQNDGSITLFCRDEQFNRKDINITGFPPYFYVPLEEGRKFEHPNIIEKEETKITNFKGEHLMKLTVRTPGDVGGKYGLREKFTKHYEADIPFVRRFMIDSGIFSGFEVEDDQNLYEISDLKPIDFVQKPRFLISDIEVYSEDRFPEAEDDKSKIIIVGFYDSLSGNYFTVAIDPHGIHESTEKYSENHTVVIVKTEQDLLDVVKDFIKEIDPDVYTGWNIKFDKEYQETRCEKFNKRLSFERMNVFDLMKAYRRLYSKGSDRLADVVVAEKFKIDNYEKFKTEMWQDRLKRGIYVNKSHVEACVQINKKYNLINFFWELKVLAGLEEMSSAVYHGSVVETRFLRKYHNKWVLNSRPSQEEVEARNKKYEDMLSGGKVFTPPVGIFEDVGNFDMTRYYPEMLVSMNLSPEPHGTELGLTPEFTLEMIDKRIEYDNMLRKLTPGTAEFNNLKNRRQTVKDVIQTIVGYFGDTNSRVFYPEIFNKVTQTGQRGLVFLSKICEEDGYKFLYGDTDSSIFQLPLSEALTYHEKLNQSLVEFCKQEHIDRKLEIKLDRYFKKIIFKRKKGTEEGVKKRYASRVIYEDGKEVDYLLIKGFEYVRRDSSNLCKEIQYKMFELMLKAGKEEVLKYLREKLKEIRSGRYALDDIATPKTLHKNPEDYPIPQDYVRGAIYANKWMNLGIRDGDVVKMLYIKKIFNLPYTDVLSVFSYHEIVNGKYISDIVTVDLEKTIEKTVKDKVEDLVSLIGVNWKDLDTTQTRMSF